MPEEEEEEEKSSPRLLFSSFGGGRERVPEGYRDKSPMAGSDVDFVRVLERARSIVAPRRRVSSLPARGSALRKICLSRPVGCLAKSSGNFNVTKSVA